MPAAARRIATRSKLIITYHSHIQKLSENQKTQKKKTTSTFKSGCLTWFRFRVEKFTIPLGFKDGTPLKVQVGAGFFTNPNLKNMFPVKLGIHFLQKIGEIGENLTFEVSPFHRFATTPVVLAKHRCPEIWLWWDLLWALVKAASCFPPPIKQTNQRWWPVRNSTTQWPKIPKLKVAKKQLKKKRTGADEKNPPGSTNSWGSCKRW